MTLRARHIALTAVVLLLATALLVVVVTVASAGRRADDARARLDEAAERLQSCRADRGTYDGCQTGEERIEERIAWDGADGYRLHVDVFGVGRFQVVGAGPKTRRFTCTARGSRCADGRWSPPRD